MTFESFEKPPIIKSTKKEQEKIREEKTPSEILEKIKGLSKSEQFPGMYWRVYKIEEKDGKPIAVKRFKAESYESIEKVRETFKKFEEEDKLVRKYFGPYFVPSARFIEVESRYPEEGFSIARKEFLMIQDWVAGYEPDEYLAKFGDKLLPSGFKDILREFIKRYRKMQKEEKKIIENQIYINPERLSVKIYDTNTLIDWRKLLDSNPLVRKFYTGDIYKISGDQLKKIYQAGLEEKEELDKLADPQAGLGMRVEGLTDLEKAIEYFPPDGSDNEFTKGLINKFHLTKEVF